MKDVLTIEKYAKFINDVKCFTDIPEDHFFKYDIIFEIWIEKLFILYLYNIEKASDILQRAYEFHLKYK